MPGMRPKGESQERLKPANGSGFKDQRALTITGMNPEKPKANLLGEVG